jgi:hypothetical protein
MSIISRSFNWYIINQVEEDTIIGGVLIPKGYCDATAMCKANGKRWAKYLELNATKPFLAALSEITQSPLGGRSFYTVDSGNTEFIGTWCSFEVAMNLAQWLSPKFAAWAAVNLALIIKGDYQALTYEAQLAKEKLNEAWQEVRNASKATRKIETDGIKYYLDKHPELSDGYRRFIYSNVSDAVNKAVFGKTAKQLRVERNLPDNIPLRDTHDADSLKLIDRIEDFAVRLIHRQDLEPLEAIKQAIEFYRD